ncbi:UNVERIFIED_ORG: hypothetical protein M2442_003096 [Methylorubrum zatmanii]|nr:hypothetical protein [Methylorubrum zatmanii]
MELFTTGPPARRVVGDRVPAVMALGRAAHGFGEQHHFEGRHRVLALGGGADESAVLDLVQARLHHPGELGAADLHRLGRAVGGLDRDRAGVAFLDRAAHPLKLGRLGGTRQRRQGGDRQGGPHRLEHEVFSV